MPHSPFDQTRHATAAALLPAALMAETSARLASVAASNAKAALDVWTAWTTPMAPTPAQTRPPVEPPAPDAASEAGGDPAMTDAGPTVADDDPVATDADLADLRAIDGTLTAADAIAAPAEPAPDIHAAFADAGADVAEQATGQAPRSLDQMLPANEHPAE
ncbi:hypothetical protein [Jannaschia sp. LMIT008]|uniref:hypothetical protein n=1 Tax=Jannaschia maritima TaxID=3032585 RepID=UPI0028119229|nr:hypothetical protein [Jannaschia sp. LMIT008]